MTDDYRNPAWPLEQRVSDLLQRMTLEEKTAQLRMFDWKRGFVFAEGGLQAKPEAHEAYQHGVGEFGLYGLGEDARTAAAAANVIQHYVREQTRLGIPALLVGEALHGLMAHGATSFPQALALAGMWDPELARKIFTAAAAEMRARGGHHALSPVLDLARDPRWGRTEETYGEDPYLGARMGVACIRGLQGAGASLDAGAYPDAHHVLATAKHFAVHGHPEGGTNAAPGNYAEREIREFYLPAFEQAVIEAGVHCVMASYNEIGGVPAHVNTWLLRRVLREEWGFRGFITSDGHGISQLVTRHGVAANNAEAARKTLECGIDFELQFDQEPCFEELPRLVRAEALAEGLVDKAVARILRVKFALGLFEAPFVEVEHAAQITNCAAHRQLALEAARKALTLLKNDGGLLPLSKERISTLAVIGPNAAEVHTGGYSSALAPETGVSVLEGLRRKLGAEKVRYAEGCRITEGPQGWAAWFEDRVQAGDPAEDAQRIAAAVETARAAEVVLLVLGENESTCREGWSETHLGDRDTLDLPGRQNELARAVLAVGKPTIVLLINGRPLSINDLAAQAPAILEGWYLGQATGTAVAEVLMGEVNPGGKLPMTFPRSVGQIPAFYNHKPTARRGYLFANKEPLFPFGHGLSYTTFAYENLRVTPESIGVGGKATVRVEVTNTGPRTGDEVVQLYIRDQVSAVTRPVQELKDFRRLTLQPGETQTVEFILTPDKLAFFDEHMQRTVEPGLFDLMVGGSAAETGRVALTVR